MTTMQEIADRIYAARGRITLLAAIEAELRAAIEEFRGECMAKCFAVQEAVSHIDHQRDYDRGKSAAAGHILRGIREIKVL